MAHRPLGRPWPHSHDLSDVRDRLLTPPGRLKHTPGILAGSPIDGPPNPGRKAVCSGSPGSELWGAALTGGRLEDQVLGQGQLFLARRHMAGQPREYSPNVRHIGHFGLTCVNAELPALWHWLARSQPCKLFPRPLKVSFGLHNSLRGPPQKKR